MSKQTLATRLYYKKYNRDTANEFKSIFSELLKYPSFRQMEEYTQHGDTNTLEHCVAVSYLSLLMADSLKIKCDRKSLIRGSLLHDYYLYDWHEKDDSHKWHGFFHPGKALKNAIRDFSVNEKEQNIIQRHMFPLTHIPPKCREGAIVCISDKICATYEIFSRSSSPYRELFKLLSE
ncbi:MAG: HD domain-containing protein [Clostridiales bacterium]|nr:HD domain-containing protein [Clostridiales bacterium]